jgi:hypothetical protein
MFASRRNAAGPDNEAYEAMVRTRNHGIMELKVLPGNVRYMDYRGFDWIGPDTAAALDNAMSFLAGGDAVIIDIRRNGGGSPAAVQYITSHFMEAGKPLMTFHMNGKASPDTTATLAEIKAPRMIGKPLYVLTSGGSASAAEEFAGHVGGYKFGELVGENTAGAGFRNDMVPIPAGFLLSVSVGRAVLGPRGPQGLEASRPHAPSLRARFGSAARALRRPMRSPPRRRFTERGAPQMLARRRVSPPFERAPRGCRYAYAGNYGDARAHPGGPALLSRGKACGSGSWRWAAPAFGFEADPASGFEVCRGAHGRASAKELAPRARRR